ncbi:hypothetical protein RB601_004437 [Gaeumannomyces tritici]
MDNDTQAASKRGRLMGKLFGNRDRKVSNPDHQPGDDRDLNDFFHGPTDKLTVPHPPPPTSVPLLTKLDTSNASRYPNAHEVKSPSQQSLAFRGAPSPQFRRRKGLSVRFVDSWPQIIGEGGDECEVPTVDISKRKVHQRLLHQQQQPQPPQSPQPPSQQLYPSQSQPPPIPPPRSPLRPPDYSAFGFEPSQQKTYAPDEQLAPPRDDSFTPKALRRTQTGYSDIETPPSPPAAVPRVVPPGNDTSSQYLDGPVIPKDERRKSLIEVQQAQMREAEGLAFAQARRSVSAGAPEPDDAKPSGPPPPYITPTSSPDRRPRPAESPDALERRFRQALAPDQSPAGSIHSNLSFTQSVGGSVRSTRRPEPQTDSPTSPMTAKPSAAGMANYEDVALKEFVVRSRHLFEVFRLHSEAVQPLMSSPSDNLARAALWWFLKGRMMLEISVRDGAKGPPSQAKDIMKQQSYADLAKGYWIVEDVLPQLMAKNPSSLDGEIEDVRKAVTANLRKLSGSMKRNGFLPPEDAVLPQVLRLSIWVDYPQLSQDIIALLHGVWSGSALAAPQRPTSTMPILESLPVGDTTEHFSYGRIDAEVFLSEQGDQSQRLAFPCLLSMVRPQKSPNLILVISSQNGAVNLKIQNNKTGGPTWSDLRWRNESCALELKLPRGFLILVQLSQADYRMLWSMYDFGEKVQSTLYPRKDEKALFRTTLRAFQYFDSDPQSRQFPKEAVPSCDVTLFEKVVREGAATGPRIFHRGFRIAVVTGPRTRTLSGLNNVYTPQMPIHFSFLKDEQGRPALLIWFDNGRGKGRMVMSFSDERERLALHNMLLGSLVAQDEAVFSDVPLTGFTISKRLREADGLQCIKKLPWKSVRVINYEDGNEQPQTVLAERLRVVFDFQDGLVTDRMNFAPGEFKIRLDIHETTRISLLRPPQQDMTIGVSETMPREVPQQLAEALQIIQGSPTVRTLRFASIPDLHSFQEAVTGFKVLFDGIASAFAIARRRMVVPIHKKWEAGATRVQVVQQSESKVTQLLAFFEDWHHGQCMGFQLKGTDVFEAIGRGTKAGIKIDDAKFPLPRVAPDESNGTGFETSADEASFVCLDLPDLPGEHDDITIMFESEADRDRLVTCLPAPVRNSRMPSLKF